MNMNRILDETDRIDQLDKIGIKELYVKSKLWKEQRKKLRENFKGINFMETKEFENLKNSFGESGFNWFIKDRMKNKYKDFRTKDFFKYMTKDEFGEEKKIKLARKHLKGVLNGGCGMPIHEILRSLLKQYTN